MESFSEYFKSILKQLGIEKFEDLTIDQVRYILSKTNEYFYTYKESLGKVHILDDEFYYFSEFHKFWERYHNKILNPTIIDDRCEKIADILNEIYLQYGKEVFYELYNTNSLNAEEICQIRYFSANQDFRGSRDFEELAKIYSDDPTIFDVDKIIQDPEDFLKNIGITKLSQNDKRVKYAKTAAKIIKDLNINRPFDLFSYFNKDLLKIKNYLINKKGSGYGNKKIDMFLRDMVVLKVWENPINFDKIDVASDVNTIKVALRTGILKTEIPLLSSFLDIFCYQYSLIDEMNAKSWRRVWEIWKEKFPDNCLESPCLIDYLVYRIIGKEFCKEALCIYECNEHKHRFKWHSPRNKTCQVCKKNQATLKAKVLPCTDEEGYIYIQRNSFVSGENAILKDIKECPFVSVCNPKSSSFIKLNPPKSISILGQTGWESARTKAEEGGGGLMS